MRSFSGSLRPPGLTMMHARIAEKLLALGFEASEYVSWAPPGGLLCTD